MQDIPDDTYIIATSGSPDDVRTMAESLDQHDQFVCSVAEYRVPTVPEYPLTDVVSTHGVAVTLALPTGAVRRQTPVCYAWDFPDSSSVILTLDQGGFPIVASRQATDVWWLSINGRPTCLTLLNHYDDGRWYATIEGYLHDNLSILSIVGAGTEDGRDELIGAVATVRWKDDEVPAA